MKKPFTVGNTQDLLDRYDSEAIPVKVMVEMLNEIAEKFYNPKEVAKKEKEEVK